MTYTFGGNVADSISGDFTQDITANNATALIFGWWYPTTLTATRRYFGIGSVTNVHVNTADTSELRFIADAATTDDEWVTSGAGIVTNKWHFLAMLSAFDNSPRQQAWRVWIGRGTSTPVEVSTTQAVTGSGNMTLSGNSLYCGNHNGGSLAFQGDIGWAGVISVQAEGAMQLFNINTAGAISNAQASYVYNKWVMPLWKGRPHRRYWIVPNILHSNFGTCFLPLDSLRAYQLGDVANLDDAPAIVTGSPTSTRHAPPVRMTHRWFERERYIARMPAVTASSVSASNIPGRRYYLLP